MTYDEEVAEREAAHQAEWTERNLARIPVRYRAAEADNREVGGGLYLFGPVGTGKTWTAAGIMRAHIEAGERTRWLTVPTWLHQQRESFSSDAEVESVESITSGNLLVLDDIGVERATPWALEMLYVLVSEAYNRETPLVVTGNLNFAQLADRIGARVVSRLAETCSPVEVSGADRRISRSKLPVDNPARGA
jgi:DNA replication protein DnaC